MTAGGPVLRLRGRDSDIVLGPHGYRTKKGKLTPYQGEYDKIGQLFKSDPALKQSLIKLRNSFNFLCYEYAALSRTSPPKAWVTLHASSQKTARSFGKKPQGLKCKVEEIVTTVEHEVEGWVESVFTVAEQVAACSENCTENYSLFADPFGLAACEAGCACEAFSAIITRTWEVVDHITETVVTEVTHCARDLTKPLWPTPSGPLAIPFLKTALPGANPNILTPVVKTLSEFIKTPLECLAGGKWSITQLKDLSVRIDGVEQIPVALTVCLDQSCTDKLKDFLLGTNLVLLGLEIAALLASGAAAAGAAILAGNAALNVTMTAVATALGLGSTAAAAAQAMGAVLVILLDLVLHGLIVGGQILAWEVAGQVTTNGVCISHPSFPIAAIALVNPVVGLVALANIPCIVTPR